jgi:hypothetical protein
MSKNITLADTTPPKKEGFVSSLASTVTGWQYRLRTDRSFAWKFSGITTFVILLIVSIVIAAILPSCPAFAIGVGVSLIIAAATAGVAYWRVSRYDSRIQIYIDSGMTRPQAIQASLADTRQEEMMSTIKYRSS